MPRKADAGLEGRILTAAYRLWRARGERALTMRGVARAAGTTTPTLYERFSNKSDLLSLLRRRARLQLFSAIKTSHTPVEICRHALDFFTARPNDYRLISEDWAIAFARKEHMPSFEFMKQSIAAQLGGIPSQHTPLALALVALLHGTATLLLSADAHAKTLIHAASVATARSKRPRRRPRQPRLYR
jgi:AcrR family transcriptional regulator